MNLSDYIAAASFIVSFYVAIKTIWIDIKQRKIQKRLNSQQEQTNLINTQRYKEEEKKQETADIHISIFKGGSYPELKIANRGNGYASNVKLSLKELSSEDAGIKIIGCCDFPTIDSGAYYLTPIILTEGHASDISICVMWDDESGKSRKSTQTISLIV